MVLEGQRHPSALVVVEFPDTATIQRWYASPEYASALEVRDQALIRSLVMVDGVGLGRRTTSCTQPLSQHTLCRNRTWCPPMVGLTDMAVGAVRVTGRLTDDRTVRTIVHIEGVEARRVKPTKPPTTATSPIQLKMSGGATPMREHFAQQGERDFACLRRVHGGDSLRVI